MDDMQANNSMQRTALRAAADAERYLEGPTVVSSLPADLEPLEAMLREGLPACFKILSIDLSYQDTMPPNGCFQVVVRFVRQNAEAEPAGWGHRLVTRVRQRWKPEDLGLAFAQASSEWDDRCL